MTDGIHQSTVDMVARTHKVTTARGLEDFLSERHKKQAEGPVGRCGLTVDEEFRYMNGGCFCLAYEVAKRLGLNVGRLWGHATVSLGNGLFIDAVGVWTREALEAKWLDKVVDVAPDTFEREDDCVDGCVRLSSHVPVEWVGDLSYVADVVESVAKAFLQEKLRNFVFSDTYEHNPSGDRPGV